MYHTESIFFQGTEEQWASVSKGEENRGLENTKVYFYSEEEKSGGKYWHFDANGNPTVR